MAMYVDTLNHSSHTKANNVKLNSYRIKATEPVDYEFTIRVPTLTLSQDCKCSRKMKIKFTVQSSAKDEFLPADEVKNCSHGGSELVFNSKVTLPWIMSFDGGRAMEKCLKIWVEDHSLPTTQILCYGRIDLAESLNECISDGSKSSYVDISLSQNMGLMTLSISPKKLNLREKVNNALSKPPPHAPISKMPVSPMKSPTKGLMGASEFDYNPFKIMNESKFDRNDSKENWNELSFWTPEGDIQETDLAEGATHAKTERRKRSSSQLPFKKPLGMNKETNRSTWVVIPTNKNDSSVLNSESKPSKYVELKRRGSSIRGYIEDSIQKISASESISSLRDLGIQSPSHKESNKKVVIKNKRQFKSNKDKKPFSFVEKKVKKEEIPRKNLYSTLEESDRISKISQFSASDMFSMSEHQISNEVSSVQLNDHEICSNNQDPKEIIDKYQEVKKKEKKYRKEVKILRMEKKQLKLKTKDVDRHNRNEAEKIVKETIEGIKERLETNSKPKLSKVLCKVLIIPMCRLLNVANEVIDPLIEIVKSRGKDFDRSGYDKSVLDSTPNKKSRRLDLSQNVRFILMIF
jgi:hypothetical protein